MKINRNTKVAFGILFVVVILLCFVFLYTPELGSRVIVVPEGLHSTKLLVNKVTSQDPYVNQTIQNESSAIDQVSASVNNDKLQNLRRSLPQSTTARDAIEQALTRHGLSANDFDLSKVDSTAMRENSLFSLGIADLTDPIEVSFFNNKTAPDMEAHLWLVKDNSTSKYFSFASYYTVYEYEQVEMTIYKDYIGKGVIARRSGAPTFEEGFMCFFESRQNYGRTPRDTFSCVGKSGKIEVKLYSASTGADNDIRVVSDCSIGSLWEQFTCRYLGQSRYDAAGNLKN